MCFKSGESCFHRHDDGVGRRSRLDGHDVLLLSQLSSERLGSAWPSLALIHLFLAERGGKRHTHTARRGRNDRVKGAEEKKYQKRKLPIWLASTCINCTSVRVLLTIHSTPFERTNKPKVKSTRLASSLFRCSLCWLTLIHPPPASSCVVGFVESDWISSSPERKRKTSWSTHLFTHSLIDRCNSPCRKDSRAISKRPTRVERASGQWGSCLSLTIDVLLIHFLVDTQTKNSALDLLLPR